MKSKPLGWTLPNQHLQEVLCTRLWTGWLPLWPLTELLRNLEALPKAMSLGFGGKVVSGKPVTCKGSRTASCISDPATRGKTHLDIKATERESWRRWHCQLSAKHEVNSSLFSPRGSLCLDLLLRLLNPGNFSLLLPLFTGVFKPRQKHGSLGALG